MTHFLLATPVPLILLAAVVAAQALVIDRLRAARANQRFYMEACLAKATNERRHTVVLDAGKVKALFRLEGRALPGPHEFNGKPAPRHPALLRPARRRKLGGTK